MIVLSYTTKTDVQHQRYLEKVWRNKLRFMEVSIVLLISSITLFVGYIIGKKEGLSKWLYQRYL